MATKAETASHLRSRARPRRIGPLLALVLALMGGGLALVQLIAPTRTLRIERARLGTIPVTIFGNAGAPGPAVVVAHGFAGSQQLMYPFAATLARNGYTALTFDFPGHGQNTAPLQGAILDRDTRAAQLSAALDQVAVLARQRTGGAEVALLGHSMGAEAVVRYAQDHPEIQAVVAVSMFYEGVTPSRPRNLLLVTGALESSLRPTGQQVIDAAAGGPAETERTYGDFAAGTARRLVFAPSVEHIGVLYSGASMAEALAWLDQAFGRASPPAPYLDARALWLGLLYLSAIVLFWPLAALIRPVPVPPSAPAHLSAPAQRRAFSLGWPLAALLPALLTPLLLSRLPTDGLLPILVGGPLALHFAVYGLLTALLGWLALRRAPEAIRWGGLRSMPGGALAVAAIALLVVGYVFASFGLPAQLWVLNYFPPPARLPIFLAVLAAMLPYFLADEWLTRGSGRPRGAYALTKVAFMVSLALAILVNPQLFFLTLIAPLFVLYFAVYGWFSGLIYRRTGTIWPGALANAAIFAWSVAAVFPLVG